MTVQELQIENFPEGRHDRRITHAVTSHLSEKYYDDIIERVELWGLWKYFDEPGRMTSEYRRLRRDEPIMDLIERYAVLSTMGNLPKDQFTGRYNIPEEIAHYPLPGGIFYKQGINRDWLIGRELTDVFMYVIENTNKDPIDEVENAVRDKELVKELRKSRTGVVDIGHGTGIGRLHLGPGRAVAVQFCADRWLPRGAMRDESGNPCTRTLRFDPNDAKHNRRLRKSGPYQSAADYLLPDPSAATKPKASKSDG